MVSGRPGTVTVTEDHPAWQGSSVIPAQMPALCPTEENHSPRRGHVLPQMTQAVHDPPNTQVQGPQRRRASL